MIRCKQQRFDDVRRSSVYQKVWRAAIVLCKESPIFGWVTKCDFYLRDGAPEHKISPEKCEVRNNYTRELVHTSALTRESDVINRTCVLIGSWPVSVFLLARGLQVCSHWLVFTSDITRVYQLSNVIFTYYIVGKCRK